MNPQIIQDPTLFTKFEINSADTDLNGRLRLSGLINYLIQSAIKSADVLGFGFANLSEQKLLWVLSRMSVEIYKPLKWYEIAEVETWPKNIERIFYFRDFVVRDQNNNIAAKATSTWLAIDLNSRRPKTLDTEKTILFTQLKDKHALDCAPEKLLTFEGEEVAKQKANYFDIDMNKHVTATRYIDWMMDSFPVEFHTTNYPQKLSINYLKETLPEETVKIMKQSQDSIFAFEGNNETNQQVAFRGKIEF